MLLSVGRRPAKLSPNDLDGSNILRLFAERGAAKRPQFVPLAIQTAVIFNSFANRRQRWYKQFIATSFALNTTDS